MLIRKRILIMMALMTMSAISNNRRDINSTKNRRNTLSLPSFKNALEVKSSIKGRIRLYAPSIKGNSQATYELFKQMSKISVLGNVKINSLTGTILIEYNPDDVDLQTLIGAIIKLLGVDKKIENGRISEVKNIISEFYRSINNGIYDFTSGILDSKSLLAIILIYYAIKDYRTVGRRQSPGYPTLLWWSSRLFANGD